MDSICETNDTSTEINIYEIIPNLNLDDIITYMSSYFTHIIKYNKKHNIKAIKDVFYSKKIPNLLIEDFIKRIIKYTNIEKDTLISSFIYINKFIYNEKYIIGLNNIYRLIIASCTIAIKFHEDSNFTNSYYGKIGGLSLKEINIIEYYFYSKINFEMYIYENDYIFVLEDIYNHREKFHK